MMKRISPTVIEINLEALRHNYRQLKKKIPTGVKTLSVVKSNAYGHGAQRIARILQDEGADYFGAGTVDEGIELREAGIKRPILILLGLVEDHLESLLRYQLTPVIYDLKTAEVFQSELERTKRKLPIHLKVDTGMTRLGISTKQVGEVLDALKKMPSLELAGLMTHLADATNQEFTARQIKAFDEARREFSLRFPHTKLLHFANSQAVIDGNIAPVPSSTGGTGKSRDRDNDIEWMARLGIALYGSYPTDKKAIAKGVELKPVLHWKTHVIAVKKVPAKTAVSYGRTFVTKKESVIGVIPVGYADGYPRILSNKTEVLLRGKRVPVVGTICMDMMMVDITSLPGIKTGEEVVLIGKQGKEEILAEELAKSAGTIPYEIFCRISERIPRVYK